MPNISLCTVKTGDLRRALDPLNGVSARVEYTHSNFGWILAVGDTVLFGDMQSQRHRVYVDVSVDALRQAVETELEQVTVTDQDGILVVNGVKCVQVEQSPQVEPVQTEPDSVPSIQSLSAAALAPYAQAYALIEAAGRFSAAYYGVVRTSAWRGHGWHVLAGSVRYSLELSDPCETRIRVQGRIRDRWHTLETVCAPKLPTLILVGLLEGVGRV